jgi:hypothetical protein
MIHKIREIKGLQANWLGGCIAISWHTVMTEKFNYACMNYKAIKNTK